MEDLAAIEAIGMDVARSVVGDGVIDRVEVREGWTSFDEPSYRFYFRIDPGLLPQKFARGGMMGDILEGLHTRLRQQGDEHMIMPFFMTHEDWRILPRG